MSCYFKSVRRGTIIIALLLASSCLVSCKKKEEAPVPAAGRAAKAGDAEAQKGTAAPQDTKRKVILNHSINLEVKDFPAALEALTRLAESSGGYMFKSNRNSHDRNNTWGEVGIRVPVNRAGGVLTGIRGLGRVESENSTAEDITENYVDLEARLKNARSSESRLSELYRKAGELADVLEVEKELTRVRGDIEAFEAKKKNWDLLTEMVTIEVRMSESSSRFPSMSRLLTPLKTSFGQALVSFVDSLHGLIIVLGAIIPWAAVFGPLIYIYLRKRRNKVCKGNVPTKDGTLDEERVDNHTDEK